MAHAYWRLLVTATGGSSAATSIAEWKMFDSGGTQIATTGGTASASSAFSGDAATNAFDGSLSTFWAGVGSPTVASPAWLQYHFASAVDVASFSITSRVGNTEQSPRNFSLQSSDDGSSWATVHQYYGLNWTTSNQVQTCTAANAAPVLAIAWRLLITATDASSVTSVAEWKMFDSGSTQIATDRFAGMSSSVFSSDGEAGAFDGSSGTFWASNAAPTVSVPQWLEYQFGSAVDVASFSITARTGSQSQTPHSFKLQKSTDGTTWADVASFTAATWTSGATQTFGATPIVQQPVCWIIT